MKKKSVLLILMLSISLLLSGCWSSHEVNTLGLTVAIGIDKVGDGYLISEQLINPKAIASQKATHESPAVVYTAEGANIAEAIKRLATMTPRKIYSSHLRMVILSEEIAKDGITDIVDYLLRFHEYRTDFFFAVAKGITANEILMTLTPIEVVPGISMYDKVKMSSEEWAPTRATQIIELANDIMADGINPIISSVELTENEEKPTSTEVLAKIGGYEQLKFQALAAFRDDVFVGWLNERESKGCNYITGAVKRTTGFASENGVELSYEVVKVKTKKKAVIENDTPRIDVKISIKCGVIGVKGDMDVSKMENKETMSMMAEKKVTQLCRESVQKAQEDLKTDIFGFGELIHREDPDYWKTVKDNWNDAFPDIPVDIEVDVHILSTGDMTKPISQKE